MTGTMTSRAEQLHRRGPWLEYGTIAWNAGEAFHAITLGVTATSLALIGFGSVRS
jgi:hypothetical protein